MKTKGRFKKGIALALSAALVMGVAPMLPGVGTKAKAGTATAETPSVTVYADSEILAGKTFAPGVLGTAEAVGKIKFGKNEDGKDQEWYILGGDSGVEGDNTAIFAASNMIYYHGIDQRSVMFEDDIDTDKNYTSDMGAYDEDKVPTTVSPNHYGASDIRQVLKQIAGEKDIDGSVTNISADRYASDNKTKLFSKAELDLLQATTVRTDDFRGSSHDMTVCTPIYYTTSDKLYLAAWDYDGSSWNGPEYTSGTGTPHTFYIGSEGGKKILAGSVYWREPDSVNYDWFWLRSPDGDDNENSLDANPGNGVDSDYAKYDSPGVRPASNLNLSSVIFASAADASTASEEGASATIVSSGTDQAAMTLRMDGSEDATTLGKAELVDGTVKVTKGTADATLIIQGKTDDTDWYFAKKITQDTTTLTAADITDHTDADLSKCEIWLEATGENGLIYAIKANTVTHTHTFPDTWSNADGEYHWKECTASDCPVADKGKSETQVKHDYGDDDTWSWDSEEHYKKCTKCDKDESIKENTRKEHTLGVDGKCEVCNYNINADHTLEEVPAKAPTCVQPGNERYWYCTDKGCDIKWWAPAGILIELDKEDFENYVVIPATGNHTLGSFSHDSTNHWQECSVCHEKLNTSAHTFSGNSCTVCGYSKSSGGTTYDDGSTKNTDRSSGGSSSGGSSGGGSGSSGMTYLTGSTTGVTGTGWVQDTAGKWWYYDATYGKIIGWVRDNADGKWYYVDAEKGRLYGWFYCTDDSKWYYLDANTGAVPTGWQTIGGKQYYFAPAPAATTYSFDTTSKKWVYNNPQGLNPFGSMYAATTTPDNQSVDADGAKIG